MKTDFSAGSVGTLGVDSQSWFIVKGAVRWVVATITMLGGMVFS